MVKRHLEYFKLQGILRIGNLFMPINFFYCLKFQRFFFAMNQEKIVKIG